MRWLKKWMPVLIVVVGVIGGVVYLATEEVRYRNRITPARPDIDFASFIDRHAPVRAMYQVLNMQPPHYIVVGDPERGGAFPSGPPVYLFSPDLVLVDWMADSGDEHERFDAHYPNWRTGDPLTAREVLDRAAKRK